jgi:hypothetical protein
MDRGIIAFVIIAGTATSYALYRTYAQVTPLSDDERQLYDDL